MDLPVKFRDVCEKGNVGGWVERKDEMTREGENDVYSRGS